MVQRASYIEHAIIFPSKIAHILKFTKFYTCKNIYRHCKNEIMPNLTFSSGMLWIKMYSLCPILFCD